MADASETHVMSAAPTPQLGTSRGTRAASGGEPGSPVLTVAGLLSLAVPVAVYFGFIHHYAVNVIYWDQWSDVYVVQHLSFSSLWAQHGDHRLLFPNLIVILLASWTHLDIVIEEYVSGTFLVAATGLVIFAHRRRRPATPWLYYFPVVLVMLSLDQVQTTLWGFQLAWCLVLLCVAASIWFLDARRLTVPVFAAATVVGMVGSFSSFMGLFIWPVGLLLLVQRRRATRFLIGWGVATLVTVLLYFHHFELNQPHSGDNSSFGIHHPIVALKYLLFSVGGAVIPHTGTVPMVVTGLVVVLVSAAVVLVSFRGDGTGARPIGAALACFGLIFAASTAVGRSSSGLFLASRYNTFYVLLLAGSYLALVEWPDWSMRRLSRFDGAGRPRSEPWRVLALGVVALGILSEVVVGTLRGVDDARAWTTQQNLVAAASFGIDREPDTVIQTVGLYGHPTAVAFVRSAARYARATHLSLFATPETRAERQAWAAARLHVRMTLPVPGSTVGGRVFVAATAPDELGVTAGAQFQLTGGTLASPLSVSAGTRTPYGWLGGWDTATVPNGTYFLTCTVDDSSGFVVTSHRSMVRVAN